MELGFMGLGQMGMGMAARLLSAGHEVTVSNRTRSKLGSLVAQGAKAADYPGQASGGDAVVTMLANDEAVEAVIFGKAGVLAALRPGGLHISSSTISVELAERLTMAHATAGQHFVTAPVFGRPDAAAAGKLSIVAAGEPVAIERAAPLLDVLGQRTFIVSATPKTASLVKLSGNFLGASVIEALGEAIALVGKGGVDARRYVEILTSSLFDAPVYKTYGNLIADGKFEPAGFAAPLGQKDIRLALAAADSLGVPMPIANILRDRFLTLMAHGGGHLDWSAIGRLAANDAALANRAPR